MLGFVAMPSWLLGWVDGMRQQGYRCLVALGLASLLVGCALPQVSAEDRLFLPVTLEFLDKATLPKQEFEGTLVGGLSAIAYDRSQDRFYALSDDRSHFAPARFYTFSLEIEPEAAEVGAADSEATDSEATDSEATDVDAALGFRLGAIALDSVTTLKMENGNLFPPGSIDPEGLVLSPKQTLWIASEGDASQGIPPLIDEFDRETGAWLGALPIPQRYLPAIQNEDAVGVQNNLGFEALTINPGGYTTQNGYVEPFRIFAATESALAQDAPPEPGVGESVRMLHYLVGEDIPVLLAEHLYRLEPTPEGILSNGLSELLLLDQGGHFLSLERTFGAFGFGVKLFQMAIADATDTSGIPRFGSDLSRLQPIRKQLVLDLRTLGFPLDNLESMTLGPQLPDGSQSLILLSDDNFSDNQETQILLFRLTL